jgi:hypothetical protein
MHLVSMPGLLVGIVFGPQFFKFLDNLIIPADLLVDGKQQGIDREHDTHQDPHNFGFHTGPLKKTTRGPQK